MDPITCACTDAFEYVSTTALDPLLPCKYKSAAPVSELDVSDAIAFVLLPFNFWPSVKAPDISWIFNV